MEGRQAEKKRKKVDSWAGGEGWRADQAAGWRRGMAGLEAVMVRNKSKTICAPLLMVLFYMHSKLFCTIADFAPAAGLVGMLEADELEGIQAAGLAGLYPPFEVYGWDDKSV